MAKMISKDIVTSAELIEDDTIYEKIVPVSEQVVKLPSKAKIYSQPRTISKTAKSTPALEVPVKTPSLSKTKKELVINPSVNQITKNLRCIAITLFLGLLMLAMAMALVIYFAVNKKGDDKNQETTEAPLPEVELAPTIPMSPPLSYSQCDIVTQWLTKFDFVIYGKHTVKALGYFYTIKNEYFMHRKQMTRHDLDDIIEEGSKLVDQLHSSVKDEVEIQSHIKFVDDVERWVKCNKNKAAKCSDHKKKLTQIMARNKHNLWKIENITISIETKLRSFSNQVKQETMLQSMAILLPLYLKGFAAYFESLHKIASVLSEQLVNNNFPSTLMESDKSIEEYACFVIAKQALEQWSKPHDMLWHLLSNEDVLTYWEDKNVAEFIGNISDGLKNDYRTKIDQILIKWKW